MFGAHFGNIQSSAAVSTSHFNPASCAFRSCLICVNQSREEGARTGLAGGGRGGAAGVEDGHGIQGGW